MKEETLKKCKHLFYKIITENNDDLQTLSKVVVRMFDTMFEFNCLSTNEKERYIIAKWIRETLLKYCIAMYSDDKKFIIKDDGTVVI